MYKIIEYSLPELRRLLEGAHEIHQTNNENANSRLFLLPEKLVFKMYIPNSDYMRNVRNLLLLKDVSELTCLDSIVLPIRIISLEQNIIGYLMPYIEGSTLYDVMIDPNIQRKCKLEIFEQLLELINRLPEGVHIGDLHGFNVIVDVNHNIHVIDIDGFTVDWGERLSVPLPLPAISGKYYTNAGMPIISKNSDIYCLLRLFSYMITQEIDILGSRYRKAFISYLSHKKHAEMLTTGLKLLYSKKNNVLNDGAFLRISLDNISFDEFKNTAIRKMENYLAKAVLSKFERRKR